MNYVMIIKFPAALQKNKTDADQEEVSQFQETQVQRAKRIMKPFVLRRLKKDVLNNLPTKHSIVVSIRRSISCLATGSNIPLLIRKKFP